MGIDRAGGSSVELATLYVLDGWGTPNHFAVLRAGAPALADHDA